MYIKILMGTIKGKGPPKNFFFSFSLEHKKFLPQALGMAFLAYPQVMRRLEDMNQENIFFFVMYVCCTNFENIFNSHEREEGAQFVELVINVCSMC